MGAFMQTVKPSASAQSGPSVAGSSCSLLPQWRQIAIRSFTLESLLYRYEKHVSPHQQGTCPVYVAIPQRVVRVKDDVAYILDHSPAFTSMPRVSSSIFSVLITSL